MPTVWPAVQHCKGTHEEVKELDWEGVEERGMHWIHIIAAAFHLPRAAD